MQSRLLLVLLLCWCQNVVCYAQSREEKVRDDLKKVTEEGFWIYNDIPKAFAEAKRTGKPIVVVLRCIPCEECVKLDDDLVDTDPVIRPLLEKFVCVRQVSTNGLDLSLFQYDTDQSFAVFFLNADRTIYGRFGTRSHRTEWVQDVSLPGLAKALEGALELHANYPANKAALSGKTGGKPLFPSPEKFPALKDKFTDRLNYEGNVVQSCIHCHQIGDAVRDYYRSTGQPMPDDVLYPYPHPTVVGWTLDPHTKATLKSVNKESAAAQAGFMAGDEIATLNGQPILSSADIQWVLHQVSPKGGKIEALVNRNGKSKSLTVAVEDGWREQGDISWRVSTWGLRRMSAGGLKLIPASGEERRKLALRDGQMALKVEHVGQYGPHAAAKNAGFQKDDILISVDGRTDFVTEAEFLTYGVREKKSGQKVDVKLIRGGKERTLKLPMQQ